MSKEPVTINSTHCILILGILQLISNIINKDYSMMSAMLFFIASMGFQEKKDILLKNITLGVGMAIAGFVLATDFIKA